LKKSFQVSKKSNLSLKLNLSLFLSSNPLLNPSQNLFLSLSRKLPLRLFLRFPNLRKFQSQYLNLSLNLSLFRNLNPSKPHLPPMCFLPLKSHQLRN
jgi:hypothetical protein